MLTYRRVTLCFFQIISITLLYLPMPEKAFGYGMDNLSCIINMEQSMANCSNLHLSHVPRDIPIEVKTFYLSQNNIKAIQTGTFQLFSELKQLYLDHNEIQHLGNNTFIGLYRLRTLSLAFNKLKYSDSFAINVFQPLALLTNLDIQGNCDGMGCYYPNKALSKATSLVNLHVDGFINEFEEIGAGFEHLSSLKSIVMDSNDGYCILTHLTEATFVHLRNTSIQTLRLIECSVMTVEPYTFSGLANLSTLEVKHCRHLCLPGLTNITVGLGTTDIKSLKLTELCTSRVHPVILESTTFEPLINTSLERLSLESNKIIYIDPKCIYNLPKTLKFLSLRDNMVDDANFLINMIYLENLDTLDVSLQNNYRIKEVNKNFYNKLSRKLDDDKSRPRQKRNRTDGIDKHMFEINGNTNEKSLNGDELVPLPRNIRKIIMNNIKLGYPVIPLKFSPNKLQYLDAAECMLPGFLGKWEGLHELQILNISSNRFRLIVPNSFGDMKNLTSLLLQNNHIGKTIMNDRRGYIFSNQSNLEVLDISNNGIKDLPTNIFRSQSKLKYLSIADNSLTSINFRMDSMKNLQLLNLSTNQISFLTNQNTAELERISEFTNITIDLSANSLTCNCAAQDFISWLASTKIEIKGKNDLFCVYLNKTHLSLNFIKEIREELKYECSSWAVITGSVTGFVGLLLSLSLFTVIHYKRWQLRYWYYLGRKNINPYHALEDQVIQLINDVYISYDTDYEVFPNESLDMFVKTRVLPYLQNKGYRVQIREGLESGRSYHDVISACIRTCSKVVVLMSRRYCKDYYNTFEFNMAVREGMYTKRNVVVPIKIGEVEATDMTVEILEFMNADRYPRFTGVVEQANGILEYIEHQLRQ